MKDFEDAVQLSAAVSAKVEYLVTHNAKDFGDASLKVVEPKIFLKSYGTG